MTERATRPVLSAALARAAVVLATLLLALVVPAPARAADPVRPVVPAALGAVDQTPVTVRIVSIAPQVLQPGQDLQISVTVTNGTDAPIEEAGVTVYLNRFRMFTRDEVAEWAQRGLRDPAGDVALSQPLEGTLAPRGTRTLTLTVPADRVRLSDLPGLWGPRGMAVGVSARGERLGLTRSYVLWSTADDDPPQVPVSVVLPFVGPATAPVPRTVDDESAQPTPEPTGTAGTASAQSAATTAATSATKDLDSLTSEGGRLLRMLAATNADDTIALTVDPSLLAEADSGSASAQRFAERLRTAIEQHETYVLPWADPDVAAVQRADQGELLRVAVDHARGIEDLDESAVLLWAADAGTPDTRTVEGVRPARAAAMVAGPQPDQGWSEALQLVSTSSGDVPSIVPDAVLTTLVTESAAQSTPASKAQRALADLAIVARATTLPAGVVIAPERDDAPSRESLAAVLDAVRASPWATTVPLSTVLTGSSSVPVQRAPAVKTGKNELSVAGVTALADARESARSFAEVLDDPEAYLAGIDDQILAPLAVAWREQPKARAELVRQTVAQVRERTEGLSIVATSDLNVIATTSDLRLTVRNDLPVPARADLVVDPRKPCLSVGAFETPILDPGDTAITVPLVAHANCDVVVEVALVGPSGQDVAEPIAFSARLSPTIESVGTIVVGILLALGLALGIARTVRRGQSARRGARTVAEADAPVSLPVLGGTPTDPVPEAAPETTSSSDGTPDGARHLDDDEDR